MSEPHERWFRKAGNDLMAARLLAGIENAPRDVILFHCQQAVEKYLKGYLVFRGVKLRKLHDLAYLLDLCALQDQDFHKLEAVHNEMQGYAVEVRYPDELGEEDGTMDEVRAALRLAERVSEFVRLKVAAA